MFDQKFLKNAIDRSAERRVDRRNMLIGTGLAGLGVGAAALSAPAAANAATAPISDASIFNFALNLEYLEAEFYLRAVTGAGLPSSLTSGVGKLGGVSGGRKVTFSTTAARSAAAEIANDEKAHVAFLRAALGSAAVARPSIDIKAAFTSAAKAAGLISGTQTFDPYASEANFLLGAFIFEDVGVTAYKGAAPFIENKTFLEAAAGILAVEAYHAGVIRSQIGANGLNTAAGKISAARDSLDGAADTDQGTMLNGMANLVPTDANAIVYSRTPGQVLNIVYLNPKPVTAGGFFPAGVNGAINTSDANG